jgi:hypothetical protein
MRLLGASVPYGRCRIIFFMSVLYNIIEVAILGKSVPDGRRQNRPAQIGGGKNVVFGSYTVVME